MKRIILILAIFLPICSLAQSIAPEMGSTDYLDYKKSYKTIKLSDDVSKLNEKYLYKISEKPDAAGCIMYSYSDPNVLNFGNNVQLKRIQLKTYHGLIASIYLFFDQEDGDKIRDIFSTAYGSKFLKVEASKDVYLWRGVLADVYLSYASSSLSAVIYSDNVIGKMIKNSTENSTTKAAGDL
jgi:hypothetical protein